MKNRLYYQDPFLKTFDAAVEALKTEGGSRWVRLSQSAFYPEGGGQPGDWGRLAGAGATYQVTDTQSDEKGRVWHRIKTEPGTAEPRPGDQLTGSLDWARRHDHMQQHTGEHILAFCVWKLAGGYVHGLHIGQTESSIDITMPEGQMRLPREKLKEIERLANEVIARDDPIRCYFPDADELKTLPLRKQPGQHEDTRVVLMGDYEGVACGGTHLARTSQAGMVKILRDQSARGKLRLFFLCGLRAARHYQACYEALDQASSLLNAPLDEVPAALQDTLAKMNEQGTALNSLRRDLALSRLPALLAEAKPLPGGKRLVVAELTEAEAPAMDALASALSERDGVITLLAAPQGEMTLFTFARGEGEGPDLSALMRKAGIKGGGRSNFARGASRDSNAHRQAAELLI